jgi:hypothetical protein
VEQLENRVFLLEHPSQASAAIPAAAARSSSTDISQTGESPSFTGGSAIFPVLGKALLGMAGAYALRAAAESGSFPKMATVALAIAYASVWLIAAVWVPATEWFASTTYATTSALILAPMLGELTLRFKVLSPAAAAGVLGAFLLAASLLAWKRNLKPVIWVADLTTAIAAIALLIATHDTIPFIAVLILMALLSEYAAGCNHWLSVRPIAAIAADFAIWAFIFIYTGPDSSRTDYPNLSTSVLLAPALLLFLLYGSHVALRSVVYRRAITLFEASQAAVAFLLAVDALFHFASAKEVGVFAVACIMLSAACYTAAYVRFSGIADHRNYHVFALWSAALLLLGAFLCVNPMWLPMILLVLALIATSAAVRTSRLTLAFHGLTYLLAAAFASGWLLYAAYALAGSFPAPPVGIAWIVAAAAILCYIVGGQFRGTHWQHRLFQLLSAMLAVGSLATVLVSGLVWITATMITPGASHVAVIRTLAGCSLALALARLGPLIQRIELVWIAYGTLACVAAKLLFEDLRQGHPEFTAASIFVYAVTLILVPRVVRRSSKKLVADANKNEIAAMPVAKPR